MNRVDEHGVRALGRHADFAAEHVAPAALRWEQEQQLSESFVSAAAAAGYLGLCAPEELGGTGASYLEFGRVNRAVGRYSVSATGLLNVHNMVLESLMRWGSDAQKLAWVPSLARGERIGALAMTELEAGSDIKAIGTTLREVSDGYVLDGAKRWITLGGRADVLLVFAKLQGQPTSCIVDVRRATGVEVSPIRDMLGFRAASLAEIRFREVFIERQCLLCKPGLAFAFVAPYALDLGRISVTFTALGILDSCLQLAGAHALKREAFGKPLIEHMNISRMIAQMSVDLKAAELLALRAVEARSAKSPDATEHIMTAKYFATKAAARHSANAVQILGARGCNDECAVARHYRDARTLQVIEGSNEIHEMILGTLSARQHAAG